MIQPCILQDRESILEYSRRCEALRYKNLSRNVKKFYGVTFQPGEEQSVKGFINDPKMVRVAESPVKPEVKKATASQSTKTDATKTAEEVKK